MWQNRWGWLSSIALFAGFLGGDSSAIAVPLENWRFDPTTNQLELILEAGVIPSYYLETEPPRITIDLPNTELGALPTQQNYSGAIRRIWLSQSESPNTTRIAIELAPDIALSPQHVQLQKFEAASGTNRWVLYPSIIQTAIAPTPARPPAQSAPPATPGPGTQTPQIQFGQPLPKSQ